MFEAILSIFSALIAIALVIIVHEWGHFQVARWCGVHVQRFSIGFGKAIWRHCSKRGTEYVLAWIPLGGYVKMQGGDPYHPDPEPIEDESQSYIKKPIVKRLAIVAAGVAMNFVLALCLYTIIYSVGFEAPKAVVGDVATKSIAGRAGLAKGDEFVRLGGEDASDWQRVVITLVMHIGDSKPVLGQVRSLSGQLKRVSFDLHQWRLVGVKPQLFPSLGFLPESPATMRFIRYPWYQSIAKSFHQVGLLIQFNSVILVKMIAQKLSVKALGGPISIFTTASKASLAGFIIYLSFIAYLSVTLGFINMLPIPMLDGGHFLFLLLEGIRGKPLSERAHFLSYRIGLVVILLVMVQAILNDVQRYI